MATGFLMYHELLRPGRPPVDPDPGYVRYAIDEAAFAAQLAWLASAGVKGISVRDAFAAGLDRPRQVVLTFDDGCETDWIAAAPRLAAHGFTATFYVVSTWVDKPGFLTRSQVRELSQAGFEIGSHSATHVFLNELSRAELQRELADSKHGLEDILGQRVDAFSCPGGRWSRGVAEAGRRAGYTTIATSRLGRNRASSDPLALTRFPVRRDTASAAFESFCLGKGLGRQLLRDHVLDVAKAVLGTRVYTRLRGAALRRAGTPVA